MFMIKPPDSVHAGNSVQINAPGSVTLAQKSWSVASGSQRFGFDAARRGAWKHEPRSHYQAAIDLPAKTVRRLRTFDKPIECCSH
jgi:hypothetical protein